MTTRRVEMITRLKWRRMERHFTSREGDAWGIRAELQCFEHVPIEECYVG